MEHATLPVTVVGGYLGAGKTTLVNRILASAGVPVAVLVNDFGDLDVDAALVTGSDGDRGAGGVLTFANGCICCDLTDGFLAALERVRRADPPPQRVMVEASGVGDLATLVGYANLPGLRLDATVCVVDAETVRARVDDRWVGDLVLAQLRAADLVVLNKVDLLDPDGVADARMLLAAVAPGAVVIDAVHSDVPLDVVFGIEAQTPTKHGAPDARHAHDRFTSWVEAVPPDTRLAELHDRLDRLPADVVRAKGIVAVRDGDHDDDHDRVVIVQVVGRRREIVDAPAGTPALGALSYVAVRAGSR